jgi:fused signal recognition particle receptor
VSETEPEKKGWFARLRARVAPTVEPPRPAEPEVGKPDPVEPAVTAEPTTAEPTTAQPPVTAEPEAPVAPPPVEPIPAPLETAPEPEPAPVETVTVAEAVVETEPAVETEAVEIQAVEAPAAEKKGWLSRLREGLSKSTKKVAESITGLFTKKKLDQQTLDDLEDVLIQADLGVAVASRLVAKLGKERFGKEVTDEEVRAAFADDIAEILQPVAVPLTIDTARKPHVVLVVGVNGSGKTTTIAKLAGLYKGEGRSVMLAAGDTFRAAAVEQLKVWGDRAGVPVVSKQTGADAAGLAYEALERARAEKTDVLLIDTAGRLHNKTNLMEELAKIVRVIRKLDPEAPHSCLLVLDATTGQNAHAQVETFKTMSPVDALVLTKLDGSAKGGVLVALAEKFKLPVVAVGVGEGIDDLRPFEARAFARGLMGLPA